MICGLMRYALASFGLVALLAPSFALAQPRGTQPRGLTSPLASAERCTECHAGGTTASGERYMAGDTWSGSMMANSARDPLFLATLTVAEQDSPGLGTVCLRCHTPSAFVAGRATPGTGSALDALEGDLDGVHCDTCHRSIVPTGVMGAPFLANAELYFSDAPADMIPARYGPRTDPMTSPRHPSMGGAFIRDPRLCGQCHDVVHPANHRLSIDGRDLGFSLPVQTTYTEWSQSDYARRASPETCQTCHMREITGETLPSTRIPGAPTRPNQRRHEFVGANEWGLAMLKAAFPGERDDEYDTLRARTREYLRTAARLEVTSTPTGAAGSTVSLPVRVTNLSGHKLPTGYEDARLMWIQVQVGSRVVSGAYTNDELVEDAQARIYRFQAGHFEAGRVTRSDFIARHNTVLEDTRIPPLGMRPDTRTAPVGRDYAGGPDGALRNFDETSFSVQLPTTPGPVPVTVRLMYQSTTKHYVETIAAANRTDGRGRALTAAWNASGRAAPFAMAEVTVMVNVTAPAPGDEGGGCSTSQKATGRAGLVALAGAAVALFTRRARRRAK
jgi:Cytochrome c554 and c-prime